MTLAVYDDNSHFIKSLKDCLQIAVVPFCPATKELCFNQENVRKFLNELSDEDDVLFLINLECGYDYESRSKLLGLYFFQCLIREFGSSQNFNYCFYSFLQIERMIELNEYAFFIKQSRHKTLPFDFKEISSASWQK